MATDSHFCRQILAKILKITLITFFAISDQYTTLKMASGSNLGCVKITFYCISCNFRTISNLNVMEFRHCEENISLQICLAERNK